MTTLSYWLRLWKKRSKAEEAKVHPALCHLYCHALELSPFPERALPAADVLRTRMPSTSTPSHIDANGKKPVILLQLKPMIDTCPNESVHHLVAMFDGHMKPL